MMENRLNINKNFSLPDLRNEFRIDEKDTDTNSLLYF